MVESKRTRRCYSKTQKIARMLAWNKEAKEEEKRRWALKEGVGYRRAPSKIALKRTCGSGKVFIGKTQEQFWN